MARLDLGMGASLHKKNRFPKNVILSVSLRDINLHAKFTGQYPQALKTLSMDLLLHFSMFKQNTGRVCIAVAGPRRNEVL